MVCREEAFPELITLSYESLHIWVMFHFLHLSSSEDVFTYWCVS